DHDDDEAHGVVIVSASMARRFWPGGSALGMRIRALFPQTRNYWLPKSENRWLTVAGVVGDVRLDGVGQNLPPIYLPYSQNPSSILHLLVRTAGDTASVARDLPRSIGALDPDEPLFDVKGLQDVMADSTTRSDVLTRLLSGFGALALALAALG